MQRPPGEARWPRLYPPTEEAGCPLRLGEKDGGGWGRGNLGLWAMELEFEPMTAFRPHPLCCQLPGGQQVCWSQPPGAQLTASL